MPTQLIPYVPQPLSKLLDGPTTIDWLVEGIIPPATAGILAADAGVGKTWLALDLALSIVTGTPWLGQFATRQGTVLIVDEENSELLLRVRLHKLLRGRNLQPKQVSQLPLMFLVGEGIDLTPVRKPNGTTTPSESFNRLLATVSLIRPTLVFFDSFTRIHHCNENAANEIAGVFANVKALIQGTGTGCQFNHHFRKAGSNKSGDRIRGSTDLRAFVDYALLMDEDSDGSIIIEPNKNRWAPPVEPFTVHFESQADDFRIVYDGAQGHTVWDWLRTQLDGNELSRQQILALVKETGICSIRSLDSMLKGRSANGQLMKQTRGREVFYHLPDAYEAAML